MTQLMESSVSALTRKSPKILEGQFAVMDAFNQNGRIYPAKIYESALEEIMPKIKNRSLCGECDHPIDYDEIRLSNVSHVITDCRVIERNGAKEVVGEIELLDTPSGKILQALNEAGIPIGISSRGIGDTKRVSEGEEVTNFKLITFDAVAEPSFSTAVLSEKKKFELEESLKEIESKLPLNESLSHGDMSRSMIQRIRESLITRTTGNSDRVHNISDIEITALKNLAESSQHLLERRTKSLREATGKLKAAEVQVKTLKENLRVERSEKANLSSNMTKLQDSYNELVETTVPKNDYSKLMEENVELRKQLAVEKRGMAYSQVRGLLEGVSTDEDIQRVLNSVGKIRRGVSIDLKETGTALKESLNSDSGNRAKSSPALSSIISKV